LIVYALSIGLPDVRRLELLPLFKHRQSSFKSIFLKLVYPLVSRTRARWIWNRGKRYLIHEKLDPVKLATMAKSKKKSDKIDSLKLAKLHQGGMLSEYHLLTREEQLARDLLIE
jgi:hypothetical protein